MRACGAGQATALDSEPVQLFRPVAGDRHSKYAAGREHGRPPIRPFVRQCESRRGRAVLQQALATALGGLTSLAILHAFAHRHQQENDRQTLLHELGRELTAIASQ